MFDFGARHVGGRFFLVVVEESLGGGGDFEFVWNSGSDLIRVY